MSTPCEDLKAALDAETDPDTKATLAAEYERKCGAPSPQDSGGNGPGPIKPGGHN